ncbi:TetR/AcrR family transcriptional regulator [Nonomuraea sp. MCN248]|uniref:TetR/AcrR family transcriptional regulator n=1 Tax=Nonomuraea corallina TaxID=2989783 RepID=A0ABT4SIN2_9ACTN|nr:TetR/AcrR family transcriptional regulator [Nonomuraea corallina]MDA0636970.1 TetR/AcrR family transcriptional regulator [Nonomuraea corallina]
MTVTAYQQAQQEGQSVVRAVILDAAKRLLIGEGPAALTVRRISGEVGCSTKVIYTLFGGKDGLCQALWLEGFAQFERRLREVAPTGDGLARLAAGVDAYREYALEEPAYYRVMFQGALSGYVPDETARDAARRSFRMLVSGVQRCLDEGLLRGGAAVEIADMLWMAMHGAVSLEISGFFDQAEAGRRYRSLWTSVLHPFLPPDERTA